MPMRREGVSARYEREGDEHFNLIVVDVSEKVVAEKSDRRSECDASKDLDSEELRNVASRDFVLAGRDREKCEKDDNPDTVIEE